jgi:hypothetical protein
MRTIFSKSRSPEGSDQQRHRSRKPIRLNKRVFVDFSWQRSGFSIRVRVQNPHPVDFSTLVETVGKERSALLSGTGIMIMRSYMGSGRILQKGWGQ